MLPRGVEDVCDARAGVEIEQRQMAVRVGEHGGSGGPSERGHWDGPLG